MSSGNYRKLLKHQDDLTETTTLPRRLAMGLLRAYQLIVSPLLGPRCRFVPSCSAYTSEAIRRYGVLGGAWRGLGRILRCHPFHPGGFDPLT
jgi:putative membrane protein insertion efficiency factor